MARQYEYIFEIRNALCAREYDTETRISTLRTIPKSEYIPPLYIPSAKGNLTSHVNENQKLHRFDYETLEEFRDCIKQYEGSEGVVLHGNKSIVQNYIRTEYPNSLASNHTMRTWFIDIETRSIEGFSLAEDADEEISLIQIYDNFSEKYYILGCKDYNNDYHSEFGEVLYVKCTNEKHLLVTFIKMVRDLDPAIFIGFNTYLYDYPYIINRLRHKDINIKPELLSPVGLIKESEKENKDKIKYIHYDIVGRILLDYRELYQKYSYEKLPRYNLETVASHELGEGKVDHSEYDSFEVFYNLDYQKFVEYSIRDVEVLIMLDKKLKLIDTAKYIAYLCGVNIPDVMGTYKQWHSLVYNEALKKGIILPIEQQYRNENDPFPGGWVVSRPNKYEWIVSFDFASLYPSVIRMLNLGVDSLIKPENEPEELSELREKFFSWYTIENCDKLKDLNNLPEEHMNLLFMMAHKDEINAVLKKYNVTASPNGYFYSKAKESIMGGLMRKIYNERVEAKNIGKKYEKAYMESKNPEDLSLSQTYDLQQYVLKILINSVYGSLSMDINAFSHGKGYSTAVTTGSRTSNRWANHIISEGIAKINKTANENGYEYSVQCDTDSGYINISSLMNKKLATMGEDVSLDTKLDLANKICDKIIQPMIDSAIKDVCTLLNAYDADVLDMEKETVADKFVSTGDKRYYCRYYKKEKDGTLTAKHKITGLALISKATPPFCKEKLRPVLDIILDEEPTVLVDYIEKVREEFEHAPIEEISIIKGLSSIDYPLKGYKRLSEKKDKNGRVKTLTAPIHSRGALIFNEIIERSKYNYGKIRAGDKVYYAMLNTPNKEAFNQNVIAYINPKFMTDSNMLKNIDYQTMFDKNFLKNITLITEPIGWSLNKYQGLSDEWY